MHFPAQGLAQSAFFPHLCGGVAFPLGALRRATGTMGDLTIEVMTEDGLHRRALRRGAAVLLLVAASAVANAYDFEADGIYYNILSEADRTCEVTYLYYDSSSNGGAYTGEVVIPEAATRLGTAYSVVAIGGYAFCHCSGLTRVTIPEGVATIGDGAFCLCGGLAEVTIGGGVTTIGDWAFWLCSGLSEVTIPESVATVGDWAFYYCTGLTRATIGGGVTAIGRFAFYECASLAQVTIGEGVTSIGHSAFYGCASLREATIPESVTAIGSYAFQGCTGLARVTIGDGVTTIGDGAFSDCRGLTEATIGEGVATIGDRAFDNCSGLSEVTIGEGVTSIGYSAFGGCASLREVTVPEGVATIGSYAFSGCTALASLTSLNPTPPSCGNEVFCDVPTSTCVLHVPAGVAGAYSSATGWEDFLNIEEAEASPVRGVATDGQAEATARYTMDGKRTAAPQKGLNILRYPDGTTRKVLVK